SMPSIAEVSQPMLRLAGMRINPRTNGPHRTQSGTGITLQTISPGSGTSGVQNRSVVDRPGGRRTAPARTAVERNTEQRILLPPGARLGAVTFSPDGKRLAFTNTRDTGIDLYIADVATGQARLVPGASINGISAGCDWLENSTTLLCGF